jgi:hypothetical protein
MILIVKETQPATFGNACHAVTTTIFPREKMGVSEEGHSYSAVIYFVTEHKSGDHEIVNRLRDAMNEWGFKW